MSLVANPGAFVEEVHEPLVACVEIATIDELLQAVTAAGWSSEKLVTLLRELNDNYSRGNADARLTLLRAVLDHIPPMLGFTDFAAAVSNSSWSRTDRSYMKKLVDFKLQDDALHRQISTKRHDLMVSDIPPAIRLRRLLVA